MHVTMEDLQICGALYLTALRSMLVQQGDKHPDFLPTAKQALLQGHLLLVTQSSETSTYTFKYLPIAPVSSQLAAKTGVSTRVPQLHALPCVYLTA